MTDDPFSWYKRFGPLSGLGGISEQLNKQFNEIERLTSPTRIAEQLAGSPSDAFNAAEQANTLRDFAGSGRIVEQFAGFGGATRQLLEGMSGMGSWAGRDDVVSQVAGPESAFRKLLEQANVQGAFAGGAGSVAQQVAGPGSSLQQLAERVNLFNALPERRTVLEEIAGAAGFAQTVRDQIKELQIDREQEIQRFQSSIYAFEGALNAKKMLDDYMSSVTGNILRNSIDDPSYSELARITGKSPIYDVLSNTAFTAFSQRSEFGSVISSYLDQANDILQQSHVDNEPVDGDSLADVIDNLIEYILEYIDTIQSKIEIKSVLAFLIYSLLPLIISLYSVYSSEQLSEQFHEHDDVVRDQHDKQFQKIEKLDRQIERMSSTLNEMEDSLQDAVFYRVQRIVPATETRKYTGSRVTWFFPGQEVELVERSGKWIRVIGYDFNTGKNVVGWVLKKYLKRVKDN